jgi:hypothetical protein
MNREQTRSYITDLECRNAAKRVREVRPFSLSDLAVRAESQSTDRALSHVALLLATLAFIVAGIWYFNPAPVVLHQIHDIAVSTQAR